MNCIPRASKSNTSLIRLWKKLIRKIYKTPNRSGAVTSTLVLLLVTTTSFVVAQDLQSRLGPFTRQLRTANPLREAVNIAFRPTPVAVDFDKDGDMDVLLASFDGGRGFHLLRNDGTQTTPSFNYALYSANPFSYIEFDDGATPSFADIDGDGDEDMLLGILDGTFRFYKYNPEASLYKYTLENDAWNATTRSGNPFYNIDLVAYASPAFIDMDNDGDDDVVIGASYEANNQSIYFFTNDGNGNFTETALKGINPDYAEVTPTFIDVDGDGDKDLVLGEASGSILYFKRTGPTSFEEQNGADNPFHGINKGPNSSPTSADFDHDGDDDLLVGAEHNFADLFYFENKGNGVFEEKTGFDNPFGGIDVGMKAAPFFTDFDLDGDSDLIIGNQYGSIATPLYIENVNGTYVIRTESNPFTGLDIPASFYPSFVDLDGDGDKDLVGSVADYQSSSIEYYKNEEGTFTRQPFDSGPFKDIIINEGKCDFVDIDNDGDYDLFMSEILDEDSEGISYIRFYKNTGNAQTPVFTEMTGTDNPLSQVSEEFTLFPRFVDIDHDGDLDALIGEGGTTVENADGNEFSYYENTGTISNPVFTYRGDLIPQGENTHNPQPAFIDYDNDGDLDIFVGSSGGTIELFQNTNPAAQITLNPDPAVIAGDGGSVLLDPVLTIFDEDNDSIINVVVSIASFLPENETLTFTAQEGITGVFDENAGILTFSGKASIEDYQTVLRSVNYNYSASSVSGRKRQGEKATITRTISINISDADGTHSPVASKTISIISGQPPVFNDHTITAQANTAVTVPLSALITDDDNDIDLTTLGFISTPASGAPASISGSSMMVDYTQVAFAGSETVALSVCDADNNCDQAIITFIITNEAPIIQTVSRTITEGGTVTINMLTIISDTENNFDPSTLTITVEPVSGISSLIQAVGTTELNLVLDYANSAFTGEDMLTIRACDRAGACTERVIHIIVQEIVEETPGGIEVFNAIAPNSSGDNRFMRITNLPHANKVIIFNRWGDEVFAIDGYDHNIPGKRFEGSTDNGKILPSGTYFYKVEYNSNENTRKTITGYLTLKQ